LNTNIKGDTAEAYVTAKLIEKGYTVSEPINDHARYDLIVDKDQLYKIQVKHAQLKDNGKIKVSIASSNPNTKTSKRKTYTKDEVDAYCIYCPQTEKVYWVDFEQAPKTGMVLRVKSENNDKRINWAEDYELK